MLQSKFLVPAVVILAALLLLGQSCKDRFGDWGTHVSGTVTDSLTGLALPGARITIEDTLGFEPVIVDSVGHYDIMSWGGGWMVFCQKDGYATQARRVESSRNHTEVSGFDFKMVATGAP